MGMSNSTGWLLKTLALVDRDVDADWMSDELGQKYQLSKIPTSLVVCRKNGFWLLVE